MITFDKTDVYGWEAAIRGMRNPMNSWDKSDSDFSCKTCNGCYYEADVNREPDDYKMDMWCDRRALRIGENDLKLMKSLSKAGDDHGKFLRMINVTVDITAPLYWWKEFDTYKVGTVANSCSTMHKIHTKDLELGNFSWELLDADSVNLLEAIIKRLNDCRAKFLETKDEHYWNQMIQLLPTSYEQTRTVQMNYQVLKKMYNARKNHKLSEWHRLCEWCRGLPYFVEICLKGGGRSMKSCPFCGGEAEIRTHTFDVGDDYRENTYGVKCTRCGVQTNQFYVSEELAESAWNRRVETVYKTF